MSDEADVANDHMEKELALLITAARTTQALPPSRTCLNCGDPVEGGRRFCSKDCQEDSELRVRQRRASGER